MSLCGSAVSDTLKKCDVVVKEATYAEPSTEGGSVFNKDVYVFYSSSKKNLEKTFRLSFLSHDKKKKGVWGTLHSQCMLTCAILLTSCIKGSDGVLGTHRNQSLLQY